MIKYRAYAGIGSRQTPDEIRPLIHKIAYALANKSVTLRSGGAPGADLMFEYGAGDGPKEIFLPWKGFNKNPSPLYNIPERAFEITKLHHSKWNKLTDPVKRLMARNAQQILGENLDSLVQFVICWTPDGCSSDKQRTENTGGTGQAISIADFFDIPVYNIFHEMHRQMVDELIQTL